VARVVSHEYNQRRAATLYVHNIPVLTFLDPQGNPGYRDLGMFSSAPSTGGNTRKTASSSSVVEDESDPTWKASRVASTIYELSRQEAKEEINARWDGKVKGYVITQGQTEIAAVNAYSILPDTTQNLDQDALQVTNRLRRLLTQSSPLRQLTSSRIMAGHGEPVAAGVLKSLQGWASWYGPAFEGRYSANGEVFDSRSMTAAHLTLPFGTQVRVTNLDNGRSVVLRINDRGPYVSGRVLDVSQAAAYALGMIHSGVAPVRVDVLGN
jgi:rare lipoprotein A